MTIKFDVEAMENDDELLDWLEERFDDCDNVIVSYATKEDATVPGNCLTTKQEYVGQRLARVDWCSPNRGTPGQYFVNVEGQKQKPNEPRVAYFVNQAIVDEATGQYVACIAVEGRPGYNKTDWLWGKDWEIAQECASDKNTALGLTELEAMKIQLGTMRPF